MSRKTKSSLLFTAAFLALWAVPGAVLGQPDTSGDAINQLARVIRWGGVVTSFIVIFVAWLVLRFANNFIEKLGKQFAGRRLFFQKLGTFFQFFVYVGTAITALMLSVRLDDKVLAIIGGTAAVSIGFAIKDLVASFIAGIMIMIDRPFQVGDRVSFGGEYGDITAIGLRSVRMTTLNHNIVTIPNNKFLNDITSCGNYGNLDMQVGIDFYIGMDQDIILARDIVNEAALTSRYVHLPKPVVVLVNQVIQDSYVAIRLRAKAYVLDTRYEKMFETDINLRVMSAFRENNIQPPAILHRSVDGSALQPSVAAAPE